MFGAGVPDVVPTDRDERVRAQRETMKAFEAVPAGRPTRTSPVCRVGCSVRRDRHEPSTCTSTAAAMMLGSPLMNDVANADLSSRFDLAVVSVDYRLAPEHPHPAGSDDCLAVRALAGRARRAELGSPRILIGGESAGGYYAALTVLRMRDELDAIDRIIGANLVFGAYDLSGTPSVRGCAPSDVPDILDDGLFAFVNECFVPGLTVEECMDPSISPLYADLHGLPPALFTVGSADHLLDDSLYMAARWAAYGNESELAVYPDCIHAFTRSPPSCRSGPTSASMRSSSACSADHDGRRARRRRHDRPLPGACRRGA
jgi:acetyl esterase/lipase